MSTDYVHGQNNPNQERPGVEMTYGEALAAIARRTSFGTEEESRAVLDAIERQHGERPSHDDDQDHEDDQDEQTPKSPAGPVKTTPAKATGGRRHG